MHSECRQQSDFRGMVTHKAIAQRLSLDIVDLIVGGISMTKDFDLGEAERGDEIDDDFTWKRLVHVI